MVKLAAKCIVAACKNTDALESLLQILKMVSIMPKCLNIFVDHSMCDSFRKVIPAVGKECLGPDVSYGSDGAHFQKKLHIGKAELSFFPMLVYRQHMPRPEMDNRSGTAGEDSTCFQKPVIVWNFSSLTQQARNRLLRC
uniref:Uncharacterized protein n=1 Tax=Sphaerodactylus townsendi TaxID=933632 RepID=A0ACB8FNH4_9SAUR